ncbi:YcaO-like family protein [Halovivax limisalsi]|uniref:YcaO-like family protein n=1 Tax=Halovivax limisalsi TaxID=1453760 RepID=UPI001FFC4A0E|nr:YcaO-like family protein [Halovivax limisalsi]
MDVHFVGDDPVRESVEAALSDVDIGLVDASVDDLAEATVAIVTDVAGSPTIAQAARQARAGSTPWIAVEVGGIGGRTFTDLDAAITGFGPETACYDCLRARIGSTRESHTTTANPRADRATVRLAGAIAGRECIRWFAGEGESIVGSIVELPHARRELHPVEGCRCQSTGRDRSLDPTDDRERTLDETVDLMERAIDDRVGLVRSIGEVDSYPTPYYLATLAETAAYSDVSAAQNAAGVDEDWNRAFVKAIGEGLERYCAGVYTDDDFTVSPAAKLESVVEPGDLVRPDDAETPGPDEPISWVRGRDLRRDDPTYLPADAVHFPQPDGGVLPSITTGLGLGSSTADALVSGLTEVIERDATMLAWYSTYDPLELELDDEAFDRLARRLSSEGLTVTPLLVTQDVDVPVVSVAVSRQGSNPAWPAFAVGSAASLDVAAAARDALAEAAQNWMELRSIGPDEADDAGAWIGRYGRFPDAARSFVDAEATVDASTVGPAAPPTGAAAVSELLDRLDDAALDAFAAKLTTRDVAAIGFEAVRVVVPDAQPLFTDAPFFGERARSVPESLGYEPRLDRDPHPYP